MKKTFLSLLFIAFTLTISCSTEQVAVQSVENMKTDELKSFDSALKSLTAPENRSTPEETERLGTQLNDRALEVLFAASKKLMSSTNDKSIDLNATTRLEKEKIIVKATDSYFKQLSIIKANQKSQN